MSNLIAKEYKLFEEIKHLSEDGHEFWYARELGYVEVFDPIDPKEHLPDFVPPQSFCYTNMNWCDVNE